MEKYSIQTNLSWTETACIECLGFFVQGDVFELDSQT